MSRARLEKEEKVKEIGERLASAKATIFADYRGLTVEDLWDLRSTLAEADTRFAVVKNTLARLAVREAGLADLEPFLEGPTAVAYVAGDPVQGAKRLLDVARRLPVLEVKGGLAEGRVLSADQVKALAALETREVMLAQLAGLAKSQMATAAWMLQALQAKFLSVLDAYKERLPSSDTEAPEPAAEEAVPQGPGGVRGADEAGGEGDTGEGPAEEAVPQEAGGRRGADAAEGEAAKADTEEEGGS
ncbi:MAG TPA: 50S ribosomal protein L10 [Actinomycetota bacterium]|jgi:large subunit ribosomal protein L10|nr:50S ribosomal protein L10 [Actinomycetota bacterium]